MNERFVAVSTVMGSRICGCFSKPRCNFSVTKGWQQMMNAVRWIKQFAEKSWQSLSHLSERDRSSAYCNATQYGVGNFIGMVNNIIVGRLVQRQFCC